MKRFKKNIYIVIIFFLGAAFGFLVFAFWGSHGNKSTSEENMADVPVNFDIKADSHFRGNFNAPNTLVVFNDFACPYCRQYALTLEKFVQNHENKVRIIWRHFPLNQDDFIPAMASECADEQGEFWQYAHELYTNDELFNDQFYYNTAKSLGLDAEQLLACLTGKKFQAKVQADYYEGVIKGVIGAPATFINGRYIAGAIPLEKLQQLID